MSLTGLDDWLAGRAAADRFSGVVLIRRGDETVFSGAYGLATRRWNVPNNLNTRFDTASITKLFTSVAVLQLVDEGRLDLKSPITELVDLTGTTISSRVTVRHLLTHTSGIADDADEEAGSGTTHCGSTNPSIRSCRPRIFFRSSSTKYPTSRRAIASGTAMSVTYSWVWRSRESPERRYRDHIRNAVFARAGMTASDFYDRREAAPNVAEGWEPVVDPDGRITGWTQNIFSYPPIGSPKGGAHTTVDDLVWFLRAVRGGELLSAERTEQFLTPQVLHHEDEAGDIWYGFGLEFTLDRTAQSGTTTRTAAMSEPVESRGTIPPRIWTWRCCPTPSTAAWM